MKRTQVIQHIQESIEQKSQFLEHWIETSPNNEIETRLGLASEQDVHKHLNVIEAVMDSTKTDSFGICKVCQGSVNTNLLELDYTASICLECLSEQEQRTLETELELSQTVQRALMPQGSPTIPGMDAAAFSRPVQIVSGDYFDFIPLANGEFGIIIADAMGHGIAASMFIASLQATLHMLLPEGGSPAAVFERINHFYLHNVNYTTFLTIFMGIFNPRTQKLTYYNAGHHPPALVRPFSNEITWLSPTGASIGIIEDYKIAASQIQLKNGDTLILYTDGLPEAIDANQQEFGHMRLSEMALKYASLPAVDIISAFRQDLASFTGNRPLNDDIALVACKVTG